MWQSSEQACYATYCRVYSRNMVVLRHDDVMLDVNVAKDVAAAAAAAAACRRRVSSCQQRCILETRLTGGGVSVGRHVYPSWHLAIEHIVVHLARINMAAVGATSGTSSH